MYQTFIETLAEQDDVTDRTLYQQVYNILTPSSGPRSDMKEKMEQAVIITYASVNLWNIRTPETEEE